MGRDFPVGRRLTRTCQRKDGPLGRGLASCRLKQSDLLPRSYGLGAAVARGLAVGVGLGVVVAVAVAAAVTVAVAVAVAVAVGVAVAVAVGGGSLGVAVGQGPPVISSTVLTVVLAVLKPSATSTRPSNRVPCACPARLPIIGGPALNAPLLMVKMWVELVETPMESAPSVISS